MNSLEVADYFTISANDDVPRHFHPISITSLSLGVTQNPALDGMLLKPGEQSALKFAGDPYKLDWLARELVDCSVPQSYRLKVVRGIGEKDKYGQLTGEIRWVPGIADGVAQNFGE